MMPAILTVSNLAFMVWIDALYLAVRSIDLSVKITATLPTKIVQLEARSPEIALYTKMLDIGSALDK